MLWNASVFYVLTRIPLSRDMAEGVDLELPWPVAKEPDVTEDEVEAVAEELAKAGGVAWYPGRERGPLLRIVSDRYRDRARLAIAALDRYRAHKAGVAPADTPDSIDVGPIPEQPQAHAPSDSGIRVGVTVVYRPPGEQRAYPCRVEKIEGGRAYLVPFLRPWTSWVPVRDLTPVSPEEALLIAGINATTSTKAATIPQLFIPHCQVGMIHAAAPNRCT
jgi:hypothetical protein